MPRTGLEAVLSFAAIVYTEVTYNAFGECPVAQCAAHFDCRFYQRGTSWSWTQTTPAFGRATFSLLPITLVAHARRDLLLRLRATILFQRAAHVVALADPPEWVTADESCVTLRADLRPLA